MQASTCKLVEAARCHVELCDAGNGRAILSELSLSVQISKCRPLWKAPLLTGLVTSLLTAKHGCCNVKGFQQALTWMAQEER